MSHTFKDHMGRIPEQSAFDRHEAIADSLTIATEVAVAYSREGLYQRRFLSQVDRRSGHGHVLNLLAEICIGQHFLHVGPHG